MPNDWVIKGEHSYVWIWHQHEQFLFLVREEESFFCNLCRKKVPKSVLFQFNLFDPGSQGSHELERDPEREIYCENENLNGTYKCHDFDYERAFTTFNKKDTKRIEDIINEYKPKDTPKITEEKRIT